MITQFRSASKVLELRNLTKTYRVHERQYGVAAALKSLIRRKYKNVEAVRDISFQVNEGEVVGFLGPNGAGKTTTIKMLSGLLYPTQGEVRVLGYDPWRRQKEFLKQITLVMGRRNQLIWDVPAIESFAFFRAIYGIPKADYQSILDELVELLDLAPLLHKPVRNLSLGERMKCELTGSLLHRPRVLFLDEPTIGLDVLAQHKFRQFIEAYNRRYSATILLTSHYMGDVEALCGRVIFIDQGAVIFEGNLAGLVERFLPYKTINLRLKQPTDLSAYGEVVSNSENQATLRVTKRDTPRLVAQLMANVPIEDLSITDPPITDVVKHVYSGSYLERETAVAG